MKPAGLLTKLKDNSKKKYREHDEWQKGKKIGRPKQVWVPLLDDDGREIFGGHWEKVA